MRLAHAQGTSAFWKRIEELSGEQSDLTERRAVLFAYALAFRRTSEEIHCWPFYDKQNGIASFRAVVGSFQLNSALQLYTAYYEKQQRDDGALVPVWIWATREPHASES